MACPGSAATGSNWGTRRATITSLRLVEHGSLLCAISSPISGTYNRALWGTTLNKCSGKWCVFAVRWRWPSWVSTIRTRVRRPELASQHKACGTGPVQSADTIALTSLGSVQLMINFDSVKAIALHLGQLTREAKNGFGITSGMKDWNQQSLLYHSFATQ